MISVIVPVYKVEKYLRKCVESIQNQSYRDLEIILVDDGSPDNCGKICDELAGEDQRIIVIHQFNTGLSGARNAGLSICKGDFVAFVDSDDTIELGMYQTMFAAMDDGCDLVICGHRIIKEGECSKEELETFPAQQLSEDGLWEEVFGRLNNSACNKLYRRELIGDLRFPVGLLHGEDLIFNLRYLVKCRGGIINHTKFYNYLKRADSITTIKFDRKKLMEITAKDEALRIIKQYQPEQISNAEKFCFRARMNILRGIYSAGVENLYSIEMEEYKLYVKRYYSNVKASLRLREKIEFKLMKGLPKFYRFIVKMYKIRR